MSAFSQSALDVNQHKLAQAEGSLISIAEEPDERNESPEKRELSPVKSTVVTAGLSVLKSSDNSKSDDLSARLTVARKEQKKFKKQIYDWNKAFVAMNGREATTEEKKTDLKASVYFADYFKVKKINSVINASVFISYPHFYLDIEGDKANGG